MSLKLIFISLLFTRLFSHGGNKLLVCLFLFDLARMEGMVMKAIKQSKTCLHQKSKFLGSIPFLSRLSSHDKLVIVGPSEIEETQ